MSPTACHRCGETALAARGLWRAFACQNPACPGRWHTCRMHGVRVDAPAPPAGAALGCTCPGGRRGTRGGPRGV